MRARILLFGVVLGALPKLIPPQLISMAMLLLGEAACTAVVQPYYVAGKNTLQVVLLVNQVSELV